MKIPEISKKVNLVTVMGNLLAHIPSWTLLFYYLIFVFGDVVCILFLFFCLDGRLDSCF